MVNFKRTVIETAIMRGFSKVRNAMYKISAAAKHFFSHLICSTLSLYSLLVTLPLYSLLQYGSIEHYRADYTGVIRLLCLKNCKYAQFLF